MRHGRISTKINLTLAAMLAIVAAVTTTSVVELNEVNGIAGRINARIVLKTRLADRLADLLNQMRFLDGFTLLSENAGQDRLVKEIIDDHRLQIEATSSDYAAMIDMPEERAALDETARTRAVYVQKQALMIASPAPGRTAAAGEGDDSLRVAFGLADAAADRLIDVTKRQAHEARGRADAITSQAERQQVIVGLCGILAGLGIALLLRARVFKPMLDITRSLVRLARGEASEPLTVSARDDEIDAMATAFNVFRANADALKAAHKEAQAAHRLAESMARHDVLTGLPNRRILAERIHEAIARTGRAQAACAVLMLDLDRFKPINDIHGHAVGDRALCIVAERLKHIVRTGETAARLGGDEFAIVTEGGGSDGGAEALAERVLAALSEPFEIGGITLQIGTSIGIATAPAHGVNAEQMLHAADLAMYYAKREARGGFRHYDPEMDAALRGRADLERRIRDALASGAIRPHYQPILALRDRTLHGFEILARWQDGGTVLSPDAFLSVAADAGLIPELTEVVLRQACRDAGAWPRSMTIALNITPGQLSDPDLSARLIAILAEEGFPARRLEVEITEEALIGDLPAARAALRELQRHGVKIALDDFGTGYSSLLHLRDLQFDKLKIDRSFVQTLAENAESRTIVDAVIGLCHSLGMSATAEGIETAELLDHLVARGCDHGQGYYLSRPLPAEKVAGFIEAHASARETVAA